MTTQYSIILKGGDGGYRVCGSPFDTDLKGRNDMKTLSLKVASFRTSTAQGTFG